MRLSVGRKSGFVFTAVFLGVCLCGRGAEKAATTGTVSKAATAPAIAKVAIPPSILAGQADLLGALRVHEPNATLDRIAQWLGTIVPMVNAEGLRAQAAAMGLDFSKMTPGGNAAAFVWTPGTNATPTRFPETMAILLPLAVTNTDGLPNTVVETFGTYSILAKAPAQLATATAKKTLLYGLAQAPMQSDLEISINTKAIMAEYGERIRAAFNGFEEKMAMGMNTAAAMAPSNAMNVGQVQRLLKAEFQAVLDIVDQIQTLTYHFNVLPDAIELNTVVEAEKATWLASMLRNGSADTPDLMQFLPGNRAMLFQQTISNPQQMGDFYLKYIPMMADPANSNATDALKALIADSVKLGKITAACSFGASSDGKLQMEYVLLPENPEAFMPLLHKQLDAWKDGPIQALYRDMGIDIEIKNHATTKKDGMTVDSYDLACTMTSGIPAGTPLAETMLGLDQMKMEIGRMGAYILCGINTPVEELAQRVKSGTGSANAAMKDFAPGAVAYLSYNIPLYLQTIKAAIPPAAADTMPKLDPTLPPVTLAGYHQDGKAFYRLRVPRVLIAALVQAAQQKHRPTAPAQPGTASTNAPSVPRNP
ncbi:MAG: hypothetical protein HY343_12425 [Lentisphaerae bacterium]|nr:hypothetical protein [Lentisphaerota bacterium]